MQIESFEWLAQNFFFMVGLLVMLFVLILALFIKLQVRLINPGITYRHFRNGRLLRESNTGGIVVLIPFLDKVEFIPPCEPALLDPTDFSVEDAFEE